VSTIWLHSFTPKTLLLLHHGLVDHRFRP
jgi:hypothetical protein